MAIVHRLSVAVAAASLIGVSIGCNKTSTLPTPVLVTETKNGSVSPSGTDTQTFSVAYVYSATDAILTVKSITSAATGNPLSITIGVAFGQIAFDGSCAKSATFTVSAAVINTPYNTSPNAPFTGGNYCVAVFDSGTVTEKVNYSIELQHY